MLSSLAPILLLAAAPAPGPDAIDTESWFASPLEGDLEFSVTTKGEGVFSGTFDANVKGMGLPDLATKSRVAGAARLQGRFSVTPAGLQKATDVKSFGGVHYFGRVEGTGSGTGLGLDISRGPPPVTGPLVCSGPFSGGFTLELELDRDGERVTGGKLLFEISATIPCPGGGTLNVWGQNRIDLADGAQPRLAYGTAPRRPGMLDLRIPADARITTDTPAGGDMLLGEGTLRLGARREVRYHEAAIDIGSLLYEGRAIDRHLMDMQKPGEPPNLFPHANFIGEVLVDGENKVRLDGKTVDSAGYTIDRLVRSWTLEGRVLDWTPDPASASPGDWLDLPGGGQLPSPDRWSSRGTLDEFIVRVKDHPEFGTVYAAFVMQFRGPRDPEGPGPAYRIKYSPPKAIDDDTYRSLLESRDPGLSGLGFGGPEKEWIHVFQRTGQWRTELSPTH